MYRFFAGNVVMFWLKKKIERQTITYIKEKILFAKKNNKKIGIFLSETKQPNINIDDWFVVRNRKSFMIILENIYNLDFPLDNILFSLDCDSLTNDPDTDDVSIIQNMLNYLYKNNFLLPPNKNITYVSNTCCKSTISNLINQYNKLIQIAA